MSLATVIYLASLSKGLAVLCFIIGALGIIILPFAICAELEASGITHKNIWKKGFITCIILLLISIALPSQDTIYLMVGANGVEQVANTPEAAKARKALNLGLDKIINNLQESK